MPDSCSPTRRDFFRAAGAGAAAALLPSRTAAQTRRPNILWITAEDMSPDMGCYGDDYALTTNLDKLAREGLRYTHAFSVSGVCAPSRSALITGMYPTTIGTMHMRTRAVPPPEVKCFPEYLRSAGYYCTNNVKTDYQFEPPVTAWDESSRTAHWRNRPHPDQPFFAVFNHTVTHESQIRAPEEQYRENTKELAPEELHDPAKAELPPYYPDTPKVRRDWARYHDNITAMDKQAARLLAELEEDGLADSTVVFFYGDHGRGLPRAKRWIYDSGLRVPLLIRWPGKLEPGSVSDRLVSFIDFGPTVLSIAGVELPPHMQGRPFLGEHEAEPRRYVYAARDRMDETYDLIRAVRDKKFKYLRNYEPEKIYAQHIAYMDEMPTMQEWRRLHAEGKLEGPQKTFFETKPPEELYDCEADPHEVNNLATDPKYQDVLERLRTEHERWMKATNDLGLVPEHELMAKMRPDGRYEKTAPVEIAAEGSKIRLTCPTEGASIAYTFEEGEQPRWLLYHKPLPTKEDGALRAKAIRIGFEESDEVRAEP